MADLLRAAEPAHDGDAEAHDDPVNLRDVDLPVHLVGGVLDGEAREAPQRHCIADHGVCGGDHGLAGDDGRACRHHEHGPVHRLGD